MSDARVAGARKRGGLLSLLARWRKARNEEGGALVETALVFGFLFVPMVLGTAEFGGIVYTSIQVANAAHDGAAFALESYASSTHCPACTLPSSASVQTAAQNSAPLTGFLTSGNQLTTAMATGCTGSGATAGNTVPTCTGGALPYVQITATAAITPLIRVNTLVGNSITLTTTATFPLVN